MRNYYTISNLLELRKEKKNFNEILKQKIRFKTKFG